MFHVVIPARMGSTRLARKALLTIAGKPMVYWVWRRACESSASSVVVATDHPEIFEAMTDVGANVVMTREDHPSGTDRLAEVSARSGWSDDTVVVNLQGDEPLMPAANIECVAQALADQPSASIATLSEPCFNKADWLSPDVVKVVTREDGVALYFSRSPLPALRSPENDEDFPREARRHVGLYAYRAGFLARFTGLSPSPLEERERLEQLRALHHGETILVLDAPESVPAGVDTQADLERVRALMDTP